MVETISIKNFKTIENLQLDCKRVNVIIGEPNSGKTNVLEALSLLSVEGIRELANFVRVPKAENMFPNNDLSREIMISVPGISLRIRFEGSGLVAKYKRNTESGVQKMDAIDEFSYGITMDGQTNFIPRSSKGNPFPVDEDSLPVIRYYRYKENVVPTTQLQDFLNPPFGSNLVQLIMNFKQLKKSVSTIFADSGYKLAIFPSESKFLISKEDDEDNLILLPYENISDTYKRLIFYKCIIEQSKRATILLDEPEAFMFPGYVKYLAEGIGGNEDNQFFIVTHNPYMLTNLIEKTNKVDLSVSIAHQREGKTQIQVLNEKQIVKLLEYGEDSFFNLKKFYD